MQTEARLCGLERLDGPAALLDLNFVVARAAAEGETAALFRLFFLVGNSPVPAGGQDAPRAALKTRARMPCRSSGGLIASTHPARRNSSRACRGQQRTRVSVRWLAKGSRPSAAPRGPARGRPARPRDRAPTPPPHPPARTPAAARPRSTHASHLTPQAVPQAVRARVRCCDSVRQGSSRSVDRKAGLALYAPAVRPR